MKKLYSLISLLVSTHCVSGQYFPAQLIPTFGENLPYINGCHVEQGGAWRIHTVFGFLNDRIQHTQALPGKVQTSEKHYIGAVSIDKMFRYKYDKKKGGKPVEKKTPLFIALDAIKHSVDTDSNNYSYDMIRGNLGIQINEFSAVDILYPLYGMFILTTDLFIGKSNKRKRKARFRKKWKKLGFRGLHPKLNTWHLVTTPFVSEKRRKLRARKCRKNQNPEGYFLRRRRPVAKAGSIQPKIRWVAEGRSGPNNHWVRQLNHTNQKVKKINHIENPPENRKRKNKNIRHSFVAVAARIGYINLGIDSGYRLFNSQIQYNGALGNPNPYDNFVIDRSVSPLGVGLGSDTDFRIGLSVLSFTPFSSSNPDNGIKIGLSVYGIMNERQDFNPGLQTANSVSSVFIGSNFSFRRKNDFSINLLYIEQNYNKVFTFMGAIQQKRLDLRYSYEQTNLFSWLFNLGLTNNIPDQWFALSSLFISPGLKFQIAKVPVMAFYSWEIPISGKVPAADFGYHHSLSLITKL